jgi:hypothetical protein
MLTGLNSGTAQNIQLGAGAILKTKYTAGTKLTAENILSATNGGITIAIIPEYFTPSIDGNFDNVKGTGKTITRYTATLSFTAVEADAEVLAKALGCADVNGNVITGRHTIKDTDYADIYAIGEKGDGSIIQFTLKNAMNTSGLSLATANNSNGGISFTISANYDVNDLKTPPYEIETIVPAGE